MSSRRLVIAIGTTAALFVVILALLAVQMGLGNDPALGTTGREAATRTAQPVTPESGDDAAYDEGTAYDQGDPNAVPQQPADQAPLQSGTS